MLIQSEFFPLKHYHNAETWYLTLEGKQEDFKSYDEFDPDTAKLPSNRYYLSTGLEAELPFLMRPSGFSPEYITYMFLIN